ncbi:AraC family transcriptional regulator [Lederbergia ruris]|uniref:AraC family transcriptional regulator n=2 Tax=Lederbergia ruris TaxID=217495 RepID=A0ABQ4KE42_9BACI|nr:AraC family transcriptional regulator [Lederbergia ruris]
MMSEELLKNDTNFHFDHDYFINPQPFESIILYQIGDLSCKGGYVVREHKQFCYEISYIVSGTGLFTVNKKSYPVREGDIILNVPKQLHSGKADEINPFRFFYMGFGFSKGMDEKDPLFLIKKMFDKEQQSIVRDHLGIDLPFIHIFKELISLDQYSTHMMGMYLRQIIVMVYRNFQKNFSIDYDPHSNTNKTEQIVYRMINYIDSYLLQIGDLTEISRQLHYNYSYLSRIFAKKMGMTIQEYYNRKRFDKAVEWLQSGEWNVTQVAEKLQYQSIHSFSKAFRKNFGVSPTEYQALLGSTKKEQCNIKKG